MSSQGLDHVGGAGAAVGHVDEGELNTALVFPVCDLAEARVALDDGGDEVDPVLRKVVAVSQGGITVDAIGALQGDGVDGEFAAKGEIRDSTLKHDFARLQPPDVPAA